jgi:hypothetical protein
MKTQLTKPSRTKARYTEEYKQEALELWRASGRSAAKVAADTAATTPGEKYELVLTFCTFSLTRCGWSRDPSVNLADSEEW